MHAAIAYVSKAFSQALFDYRFPCHDNMVAVKFDVQVISRR